GHSASSRLMENVLIGMEPDYIPRYKITPAEPEAAAAWQRITDGLNAYAANPRAELADVAARLASEPGKVLLWYAAKAARFWTWSIVQGYGDIYVYDMVFAPFDEQPMLRAVASICHGLNDLLMWAAFAGVVVFSLRHRRATGAATPAGVIVVSLFLFAT